MKIDTGASISLLLFELRSVFVREGRCFDMEASGHDFPEILSSLYMFVQNIGVFWGGFGIDPTLRPTNEND